MAFAKKQADQIDILESERLKEEKKAECYELNLKAEQKASKDQENLI